MRFIATSTGVWINPDHIQHIQFTTFPGTVRVEFCMVHKKVNAEKDFESKDEARAWLKDELDIELD